MIEDVEEVRAELQLETLSHGEMLAEREVPDLVARPLQSVAADVAKRSQRRIVVQAGIEKHQLSRGRHASGRETESGRCETPPTPPSEFAKFPLESSTVNQFPLDTLVIPAICHPPINWFAKPPA